MKVKVTEYRNLIVIETLKPEADKDFVPVGPGKVGSVLINTRKHLGISKKALALMKRLDVSSDDIGEIDAWKAGDRDCFSWMGPLSRVVGLNADLARGGWANIAHIDIPNETSEEIVKKIDEANK